MHAHRAVYEMEMHIGRYDRSICLQWRCGRVLNYFVHMFTLVSIAVACLMVRLVCGFFSHMSYASSERGISCCPVSVCVCRVLILYRDSWSV